MKCDHNGYKIETFEAGKGLWHARIRRADLRPVVIDDVSFPALEIGFAWPDPETAIADAKAQIDLLNRRGVADGPMLQPERSAA
jgi:hypothetical protein